MKQIRMYRRTGFLAFLTTTFTTLGAMAEDVDPAQRDTATESAPESERAAEVIRALPCRPTIACTADIVPAGSAEIELGYAQRRVSGITAAHGVQALAKYSITNRFQLQLGSNGMVMGQSGSSTRTLDGAFAGPKLLFVEQGRVMPAIGASVLFAAPTRSGSDAAQKTYDANVWAYISKDIVGFHADLNLGLDFLSFDKNMSLQTIAALAVSHDLFWGLGVMGEVYGFHGGAPYVTHDAGFLAALSYSPVPELVLDAGVDTALYQDVRMMTGFAGVTLVPGALVTNHRSQRVLQQTAIAK